MEANAYDNNAEINHTWELKCQHCQSCQQCGLFRRLILDLITQGGKEASRYCRRKVEQRLLPVASSSSSSSHGICNVYCQQGKVVGCASSACRVGHGSLGAKPLQIVRVLLA